MTVETATFISQLDAALPTNTDPKSEGDNHLRLLKSVLKGQFPNFGTNAINPTAAEVNYLVGVTSGIQGQINAKGAIAGQAWTGSQDFTGSSITVPTLSPGANGNGAASVDYANALSFAAALPGQTGNAGKFVTTNGTAASWTNTLVATSLNGGQFGGLRRRTLNGNFDVNQRAVTGTVTLAAGAYGHDGWKAGSSGCTYTFATANGITTLTISAGSLQQVIEGALLGSGTYCLSWTGTAQGKIAAGSYSASGVTASVTGGANLTIEFNTGTLSLVQLELGTLPTPFEWRPASIELLLAQRYFRRVGYFQPAAASLGIGRCVSTTTGYVPLVFGLPMRAIPVVTVSSATGFSATSANNTLIASTAMSSNLVSSVSMQLFVTVASGLVAGDAFELIVTAGNFVDIDAGL